MNFMTLQRPTFEELERRRQVREHLSPQRSTTLQRRESMLSRGINAIMRRQSFMGGGSKPNLKRNDSFFMHSSLMSKDEHEAITGPISMMMTPNDDNLLHSVVTNSSNNRPTRSNLGRAKSFKYPERISQIPPAEITRIRSRSQVRSQFQPAQQELLSSSEDPMYTSSGGSGGSAAGSSGKSLLKRNPSWIGNNRNTLNPFSDDLGYGHAANWLNREMFHQPARMLPSKPATSVMQRPSPRDLSEPPPVAKRRLPLPDIFYYGDRWNEQESRRMNINQHETPEPPPGSIEINNNSNNSYFEDHLLRPVAMVSRRKILSRSRDDLNLDDSTFRPNKEEEDVWYAKEKLYNRLVRHEGPTERKRRQREKEKEAKLRAAEELRILEIREYIREKNINIQNPNRFPDMNAIKMRHEAILQAARERSAQNLVTIDAQEGQGDEIATAAIPENLSRKRKMKEQSQGEMSNYSQLRNEPIPVERPSLVIDEHHDASSENMYGETEDDDIEYHHSFGQVYESQELFNGEKIIMDKISQQNKLIDPTVDPPKITELAVNPHDSDFDESDGEVSIGDDQCDTENEMRHALRNPTLMRDGVIAFIDDSEDEASGTVSDTDDPLDNIEARDRDVLPVLEDGVEFDDNFDPNENVNDQDESQSDSDSQEQLRGHAESESLISGSRRNNNGNSKVTINSIIGAPIEEDHQVEDDDMPPPDFQIAGPQRAYNMRRMTRDDFRGFYDSLDELTCQKDRNSALYRQFMTIVNVMAFKEVQATIVWNMLSAAINENSLLTYPTIRKQFERMLPKVKMIYEFLDNEDKETYAHVGDHYPRSEFPRPRFTLMCEWTYVSLLELYTFFLDVHQQSYESVEGQRKEMDLFVDGVPLTKSGDAAMNACTLRFNDCEVVWPLAIQIYRQGHTTEMLRLVEKVIDESLIHGFTIRRCVGDSPMRAKFKCVSGHAGYFSCERCYFVGKYDKIRKKMTFPHTSTLYKERNMSEWRDIAQKLLNDPTSVPKNKRFGITGYSPLLKLPYFDIIDDFPVDPMHNVSLGCCRRIMHNILNPRKSGKTFSDASTAIAEKFDDIWMSLDLPSEFARRPRSIKTCFIHYKAVEFMCIIVCGFHALYKALEGEAFRAIRKMWIYFVWIVRMALLPCHIFKQKMTPARAYEMQKEFYQHYQKCFGAEQCVFNIHSFSHLFKVKYIALLSLFSALPFESYFSFLKRIIVPNTLSFSKQVMTKSFISNIQSHSCKSKVKLSLKAGPKRHSNNLVVTFDGRYYCLKKENNGNYFGTHIGTKRFYYPEVPELDLTEVYIRQIDVDQSSNSDEVFIHADEIMCKAIICENLIIAVPNETFKV